MPKRFEPCKVCNSPGNGFHFGVEACRGCTSFFRRSIVQDKHYICYEDANCDIGNVEIEMAQKCRKCRFEKCLVAGMKKELVQKGRDSHGSRKSVSLIPSPSSSNRLKFPVPFLLLDPIGSNYSHLESVRLVVHLDEGTSLFTQRTPKRHTFKDTNKLMHKEFEIVGDWILNSFPQFSEFPTDQINILLRHFYLQFFILEGGFIACKNGRNDVWFLPNGDYIDCQNLASFYTDPDNPLPVESEHSAQMFKGSCTGCRRMVTCPMLRENIDQFEFLALTALILFETGLDGQSKQCTDLCIKIRSTVQRELLQYYASKKTEEYSLRMGNILSILPSLQVASIIKESCNLNISREPRTKCWTTWS
uniref:Nuclear receptor domain-containing protein n=1 Tax=Caenorhabditis tropicalis TaxID=1561998 RepID=A0A1I7TPX4_9PELO